MCVYGFPAPISSFFSSLTRECTSLCTSCLYTRWNILHLKRASTNVKLGQITAVPCLGKLSRTQTQKSEAKTCNHLAHILDPLSNPIWPRHCSQESVWWHTTRPHRRRWEEDALLNVNVYSSTVAMVYSQYLYLLLWWWCALLHLNRPGYFPPLFTGGV